MQSECWDDRDMLGFRSGEGSEAERRRARQVRDHGPSAQHRACFVLPDPEHPDVLDHLQVGRGTHDELASAYGQRPA